MKASALLPLLLLAASARAEDSDPLKFFEEEAKVISASLRPKDPGHAPATVRVVTCDEIKASGARTIGDALRAVAGVDVMTTRTGQQEIGIRGLDKPINNRTLILLDGKTVLNGLFENIAWENIPVTMAEIDRIEVVEGPASALYGANAISGVINVITKTPEQLKGGLVYYGGGSVNTHDGAAMYGGRAGKHDYKLALGESYGNRFENSGLMSSRAQKAHGLWGYDFSDDRRLELSAGVSKLRTQDTAGGTGTFFEDGAVGFARADYRLSATKVRLFWNSGRTTLQDFAAFQNPQLHYDTYDANIQHSLSLPFENNLVVGAGYRRNTASTALLPGARVSQDLWSLFFEDEWLPAEKWTVVASGRVDRHPLTPLSFSPHGSVIYDVASGQTLRFSAGTAFRNPTLLENYLQTSQDLPNPGSAGLTNPPITTLHSATSGNRDLDPERMFQMELSHSGQFGPVKTGASAWYYRLRNTIQGTNATVASVGPTTANLQSSFFNGGGTRGMGFELTADARLRPWLDAFANYSYQDLKDDVPSVQTLARSSPRHKVNGGVRAKRSGWNGSLWADWVDATYWNANQPGSPIVYTKVADYALLNGRVGYAFTGRWSGLELALTAFNMTDRAHYETLPAASPTMPGQYGEIVRSRWMGTAEYRF
jgi:iron complex outermembrane receptor protein